MSVPSIPGIDKYPDLQKRFVAEYSMTSARGCSGCRRGKVVRKYAGMLRERIKNNSLAKAPPSRLKQ